MGNANGKGSRGPLTVPFRLEGKSLQVDFCHILYGF